jgi:hypothetical protein
MQRAVLKHTARAWTSRCDHAEPRPGLITGVSNDDPSGIATYSQVAAQFGYSLAWTLLFGYPLMCAIQEISARIGRVTGAGIAGNLRRYYPAWRLNSVVGLLVVGDTIRQAKKSRTSRHGPKLSRSETSAASSSRGDFANPYRHLPGDGAVQCDRFVHCHHHSGDASRHGVVDIQTSRAKQRKLCGRSPEILPSPSSPPASLEPDC